MPEEGVLLQCTACCNPHTNIHIIHPLVLLAAFLAFCRHLDRLDRGIQEEVLLPLRRWQEGLAVAKVTVDGD
jgi:hypothetical protein